jgi:hypothetical protein
LRICVAAFDRSASLVGQGQVDCFAGVDDRLVMDGGDFVQPQLGITVLGYFVLLHMVFDGSSWSASLIDRAATSKLLTRAWRGVRRSAPRILYTLLRSICPSCSEPKDGSGSAREVTAHSPTSIRILPSTRFRHRSARGLGHVFRILACRLSRGLYADVLRRLGRRPRRMLVMTQ